MSAVAKQSTDKAAADNGRQDTSVDRQVKPASNNFLPQLIGNQAAMQFYSGDDAPAGGPDPSLFTISSQHDAMLVQAKLRISQADDTFEREADAVADRVMGFGNNQYAETSISSTLPSVHRKCAGCEEEDDSIQCKPGTGKHTGSDNVSLNPAKLRSLQQGGSRLPDASRGFFESSMGEDFSTVRMHTDGQAGALAKSIQARAFTYGNDIAFAPGQYDPHSHEGRRLLAHELVHTVQQNNRQTIYRDGEMCIDDSSESQSQSLDESESQTCTASDGSFDPYAENVTEMTNLALINAILDTNDWLAQNTADAPDQASYQIWEGRLEDERVRRVGLGHVWLETVMDRQSYQLYQLIGGANGAFDVVEVTNDELIHGEVQDVSTTPMMTEAQFHASIASQGARTMSLADYQAELERLRPANDDELARMYGVSGATSNYSPRDTLLADAFVNHNLSSRSGAIAEAYALTDPRSLYGFGVVNRNDMPWQHPSRGDMQGNFPLGDQRNFLGLFPPEGSVKMRLADTAGAASPSAIANYSTYLRGYAQMLNMDPSYRGFEHFASNAGGGRSPAEIRSDFGLIVPADDVGALRNLVGDPTARDLTPGGQLSDIPNYQRAEIRTIYDGLLRDMPLQLSDGSSITSIQQLDAALETGRIGIMEHDSYLRQLGNEASSRIYANSQFTLETHRVFETAYQDIHPSLRPEAPPGRPVLHTSTRDRSSGIADSSSSVQRYGNYLDRLASVIPEGTGALHVDVDDAASLQSLLRNPLGRDTTPTGRTSTRQNFQRSQLNSVYNAVLQRNAVTSADGVTFNSVEAIHAAYEAGNINVREYSTLMHRVGRLAASQVQARTPEVVQTHERAMAEYRQGQSRYRQELATSRSHIESRVSPEYMGSLSYGGGLRGDLRVSGRYGAHAGLFGAGLGALHEAYNVSGEGRSYPEAAQRIVFAGGREGLRSGTTSALETMAMSQTSRYALHRGLGMSAARVTAMRLGSRFVPGGAVDMGFEGYDILTDNRTNSGEEVSYRLGRAFVIGGSSALAGAYAGAAAGTAIGTVVPGIGNVVGFVVGLVVGALVGAIVSSLIPSYDELVREQVPLKEFEKNIQAQSPRSLRNQILAQQEFDLLNQLVHGPQTRGPYNMDDIYQRRAHSNDPGYRIWSEALIGDQIHGGCQSCHTRNYAANVASRIPLWDEARLAPVDRMAMAAIEEHNTTTPRPQFMGYDMPATTVPPWMQRQVTGNASATEMSTYINLIQPNIGAWRDVMGPRSANQVIPRGLMNRSMDEGQLYNHMQTQINARQAYFESHFGEVGEDQYSLYRSWMEEAQR